MVKQKIHGIQKVMEEYYKEIKDKLNIIKAFESSGTDEESWEAMIALRPKSKLKFKQLIHHELSRKNGPIYKSKAYQEIN